MSEPFETRTAPEGSVSASRLKLAFAMAIVVVVGAYANHFRNDFHFDDSHVIVDNVAVRSLVNAPRFFLDASTFSAIPEHQTYRPLLTLTYAIDYRLGGGLNPLPFHVSQLLFHLLVGVGLFLIFRWIMDRSEPGPGNEYLALFGAVWFCIHTANTESVNYLSSRSDVLSTMGIVWSFVTYLYVPGSRRWHLYTLPMLIGALAKTPAVMFAPMLVVFVLLFEEEVSLRNIFRADAGTKVWGALLRTAPVMLLGLLAFVFVEGMAPDKQYYGSTDRLGYLRTQPWVWLHYLKLFVVPIGLTADTDWSIIAGWSDTRIVVGLGAIGLLALTAVRTSGTRAGRPIAFGLAWFALGLLPASSIFPLSEVANEHRIYLPFAGLTLAACWAALRMARGSRTSNGLPKGWAAVGVALLAAHFVGTIVRNQSWRTEETLWADVVTKSPENGRAWMNYGLTQMEQGLYDEALGHFTRATELWPGYPPALVNLGIATHRMGDTIAADIRFTRALQLDPRYGAGHFFYGRYLVEVGRAPEAIEFLRNAVELQPNYAPPRHLLLKLYHVIGSEVEVRALAAETVALDPSDTFAQSYLRPTPSDSEEDQFAAGLTLTAQGSHLDAGIAYKRQLARSPDDPDAMLNLGWSYAQLGFDALASLAFQQVLELRPGDELAASNLAWVAQRGRGARGNGR